MKRTENVWDNAIKIKAIMEAMIDEAASRTVGAALGILGRCRRAIRQRFGGTFCINKRRESCLCRKQTPLRRRKQRSGDPGLRL